MVGRAVQRLVVLLREPAAVGHRKEHAATGPHGTNDRLDELVYLGDVLERLEGARNVEALRMPPRELRAGHHLPGKPRQPQPLDRVGVAVDADRMADQRRSHPQEGAVAAAEIDHAIDGRQLPGDLAELPP